MQTAQRALRYQHRLLGFAAGRHGQQRKVPSRTCRRAFIWNSQDFSGLVSKVSEKAVQLRDTAVATSLEWAKLQRPKVEEPQLEGLTKGEIAEAVRANSVGFGFSAGGMLFPYYIGVLQGLRALNIANDSTQLAGSSAGSIIAVSHHSGLSIDDITAACLELAEDCRQNGTRGRLGEVLEDFLYRLLPDDVHERCQDKVFVAVTKAFPRPQGQLISQFTSKDDLIQTVLTSCHIPWWFDSNLTTEFRGASYYDGGLSNFLPLPPTVKAGVRVCCFPSKQINSVYSIQISPDSFAQCPYTMRELLSWAFQPAEEEVLVQLVSKGRADAEAWALVSGAFGAAQELETESPQQPALKTP